MNKPVITVQIPHEPGKENLGAACNRAMEQAQTEWVLLLDHDLYIANHHWYEAGQEAIRKVGADAGWISCVTNRVAGGPQLVTDSPPLGDNVLGHIEHARQRWQQYGTQIDRVGPPLSGLWILTNKTAWRAVGGFVDGWCIDYPYSEALHAAGYGLYVMPGLYAYHLHKHLKREVCNW